MGAGGAKEFSKSADKIIDNDEVVTFDEGQRPRDTSTRQNISTRIEDDSKLFEAPRQPPEVRRSNKKESGFAVLDVDEKSTSCKESNHQLNPLDDAPAMVAVDISEDRIESYEDVLEDVSPEKQVPTTHFADKHSPKKEPPQLSIKVPDSTPTATPSSITTPTNSKKKKKKPIKNIKSNNALRSINSTGSDAATPSAVAPLPQLSPSTANTESQPKDSRIYYPPAEQKSPVLYKRQPQARHEWSDLEDASDSLRDSQHSLMGKIAAENNKLLELQRQRTISTMNNAKLEMEVDALMKQLELLDKLEQDDEMEFMHIASTPHHSEHNKKSPHVSVARKFPVPSPTAAYNKPVSPRNFRGASGFDVSSTGGAPLKRKTSFRYEGSRPTSHDTSAVPTPSASHSLKSPRDANLVSMSPIQVSRHRPMSPDLPDFQVSPSVNKILSSATVAASPTARYADAKQPTAGRGGGRHLAAQVIDGFKEYKHQHSVEEAHHDMKKDRSRNVLKNLNKRHQHHHDDETDIYETSTSSLYTSPSAALLTAVAPPKPLPQNQMMSGAKIAAAADMKSELKNVRGRRNGKHTSSGSAFAEKPPRQPQQQQMQPQQRTAAQENRSLGRMSSKTSSVPAAAPDWSKTMDIKCSEVELLLRKPIHSDDDIDFVLASADAGLLFMDELNSVAKRLNLLRGTLTRWLLPYDNNTRIDEQSSSVSSVVNSMPDALYGKLTEKQVNYLVTGANSVRQLIRIKIADDNDLEQAKEALKTSVDFFRRLQIEAENRNMSPYKLMTSR